MEPNLKKIIKSMVFLIDDRFEALGKNRCRNLNAFNMKVIDGSEEELQMASIVLSIAYHPASQKPFISEASKESNHIKRINQLGKGVGVKIELIELKDEPNDVIQ